MVGIPPKPKKTKSRPTGSYALVLRLPSRRKIQVGKLGLFEFPRGHYIYLGSALGGLDARVGRHLSLEKNSTGMPITSALRLYLAVGGRPALRVRLGGLGRGKGRRWVAGPGVRFVRL